jgi:hypothetical protein
MPGKSTFRAFSYISKTLNRLRIGKLPYREIAHYPLEFTHYIIGKRLKLNRELVLRFPYYMASMLNIHNTVCKLKTHSELKVVILYHGFVNTTQKHPAVTPVSDRVRLALDDTNAIIHSPSWVDSLIIYFIVARAHVKYVRNIRKHMTILHVGHNHLPAKKLSRTNNYIHISKYTSPQLHFMTTVRLSANFSKKNY